MKQKILTRRGDIFKIIIIFLLGLAIYSNTFHASFHFDDQKNIITNFAIRNLWNLRAVWSFLPTRFFTYFSLAFNYHFHQLSLPGYHIFNLAIHLGAAMLVSWFVLLLFSTPALKEEKIAGQKYLLALFSGLLFVSHPVQTQAVTYIIQRTASLATFFYLLSICLYLRARLNESRFSTPGLPRPNFNRQARRLSYRHGDRNDITIYYLCSVLAALAALFTKESAVTLPFMLLFCEVFFFRNNFKYQVTPSPSPLPLGERIKVRGELKRLAPFFFALGFFLVVFSLTGSGRILEVRNLQESQSGLAVITPVQYLLTQFRVIVTYLRLLLAPVNQNLDYDYPIAQTLWQAPTLISFVFILLTLAAAVLLFRKRRLLSFGIFWFFLALVPESSVLPVMR